MNLCLRIPERKLNAIINISKMPPPKILEDIPNVVDDLSFILFRIENGICYWCKIYLPFLIIDVVVANILLGMGMMVLPPVVISLPFKYVAICFDGWLDAFDTYDVCKFYGL